MINPRLAAFGFFRIPLAVSLPLVLATTVLAQNPAPTTTTAPTVRSFNENGTEEATTERVFVTGSAIPTAAEVGPNPVLNVTRDLINKSGERNTEELLRNLPVANANGVPVSNNENGSNTAVGAATIALRGFDARATLILLDGRRVHHLRRRCGGRRGEHQALPRLSRRRGEVRVWEHNGARLGHRKYCADF